MATNLELLERVLRSGSPAELELAARNMAQRLDIIANMKPDAPVGQLQLITGAQFFNISAIPEAVRDRSHGKPEDECPMCGCARSMHPNGELCTAFLGFK